jgi:hypothetical protein
VLTIRSAAVVNGAAVVEGGNAPRGAPIAWEGARVTQANNGGNFAFQGVVPADCVGRLEDGVPADAVDVALANCEPASSSVAPVPQTGQTQCYSSSGSSIPCAGTGQDGEFQAGVAWPVPRFTDHGNGTVRDNLTGLIWLKDALCVSLVPGWANALAAVADLNAGRDFSCAGYTAGTFADWRLPNVKELQSVIDLGHINPALPPGHPFSGVQSSWYWSSNASLDSPGLAWGVALSDGSTFDLLNSQGFVWPVRGGD